MFRKPFHVRSNTAMRGSDRRRLRSDIGKQYPSLSSEDLNEMFPNKGNVNVMKLTTHQEQMCQVYTNESQPLFFEIEQKLYPTVYTMWHYPDLMPSFSTWPPVIDKLRNGADLMLPGVVVPLAGLPDMRKHQQCAVNVVGNRAAMAVGHTHWSTSDMRDSAMKGKGVIVIHTFNDHLWQVGDKSVPPNIPMDTDFLKEALPEPQGAVENNSPIQENLEQSSSQVENGADEQALGVVVEETLANGVTSLDVSDKAGGEGAVGEETASAIEVEEEEEEISPVEKMDALLYQCLLHALKTQIKKSELPMTTINVYRTHMRNVCPPGESLDVKKSSYKKLGKFLSHAQSRGLLEVKETSKGVDSLMSFDPKHQDLLDFETPDLSNPLAEDDREGGKPLFSGDPGQPERGAWQGKLQEMYSVTSQVLPVLKEFGYRKGSWMKAEDIRKAVTDYVKSNQLVNESNKSIVVLDPILHDIVISKSEGSVTHIPWDHLFKRFIGQMTHGYQMVSGKDTGAPWEGGVVKGKLKPINLKIEKKMGNKVVTVVSNLEPFRIDPKVLSQKLSKGVAASSSISQSHAGLEVRVQGNQINFISKLLTEEYQIPKRHITGMELAPKKGKKR